MDKGTELFDAWEKTATDFLEIGVKMQKQLLEDCTEATAILREASANLGGEREGFPGKGLFSLYTSGVSTMFGASKVLAGEIIEMQETWKHTLANQVEMGKEMAKHWALQLALNQVNQWQLSRFISLGRGVNILPPALSSKRTL